MTKTSKPKNKRQESPEKEEVFKFTPMMKLALVGIIGTAIAIFAGAGFILLSLMSGLDNQKPVMSFQGADKVDILTLSKHAGRVIDIDIHTDGVYVVTKHNEKKSYEVYYYGKGNKNPVMLYRVQK